MPPKKDVVKKKKTTKKSAKAKSSGVIDGVSVSDMAKEQMLQHIARVKNEVDKEREERNFYQVERDKIMEFWEVTKKQLNDKEIEIKKKDEEMEQMQNKYLLEIEVYKQKIKLLLHEQEDELCQQKLENLKIMQEAENDNRSAENNFLLAQMTLKKQMRDQEVSYHDLIKDAQTKHCREIVKLQETFYREMQDIESKYEKKIDNLRKDIDVRHMVEIQNVEQNYKQKIMDIMEKRDEDFTEMRNHYNDLVEQNSHLIDGLKAQVEEMKANEQKMEQQLAKTLAANKKLSLQVPDMELTINEQRKKLSNYDTIRSSLQKTKSRLAKKEEEVRSLQLKYDVLEKDACNIENERDVLKKNFKASIQDIQQKCGLTNLILEEKMKAVKLQLENRDKQIHEMLLNSSQN